MPMHELPEGISPDLQRRVPAPELGVLREEQLRLRQRQDDLERQLREQAKKKDDDKGDDEKDGKEDEKEKPSLKERLKKQWSEHPGRSVAILVAVVLLLVGGLLYYLHTRTYEETDDAQIDADMSAVSPRVSGTVTAVYVVENQEVHTGDLIAELDGRDLDAALAQARAGLQQAEAQLKAEKPSVPLTSTTAETKISTTGEDVATSAAELAGAERDLAKAQAEVERAEANQRLAVLEEGRIGRLAAVGAVAVTQSDQRITAAQTATASVIAARQAVGAARSRIAEQRAKLSSAKSRLEQARTDAPQKLEASKATVTLREAMVASARAQLDQAELNRSYARIVAPVDGIVGKKNVNVGERVAPGQQLLAITQMKNMWVTANYRETQLRKMNPGQKTVVYVDALGLDFRGSVESLPGATGAKYSLLPPENATGNYVKVVQRLPVRIKLDPDQPGHERLRPGMSVEPKVTLR